jgi:predicted ATPase/DNA-binding winged helix-turn-helix (wHTH) protein
MMIQIGNLQVYLERREIRHDGATLHMGSRAFDILALLIHADGTLVSKDEIMRRVWPTSCVEENNLQVHVAALRKALGCDRSLIKTIPGRGYQLVRPKWPPLDVHRAGRSHPWPDLPVNLSKLVGRDSAVSDIATLLGEVRSLTLVGAGGIGKTSLAIEVAHRIGERFRDGVCFLELAALSKADAVLAAVAAGADAHGAQCAACPASARWIADALSDQQRLVVLDNAEHVIDVVTDLVAAFVARAPGLRVLVTSREPLRLDGETIFRVPPLDVPAADAPLDEVVAHSAVQLFLCRARAIDHNLGADPQSVRLAGDICRRLDGIALAIELAAARAATLGIEGVYERLDDRLQLLTGGNRRSLPRHQTLRATFDWSYALLDPPSRTVFRRLGVFVGAFTFESICAVAMDPGMSIGSLIASISELAAKSLLNVELDGAKARYRLSESTRAYAMDKLRDEGEVRRIAARHARFLQQRFEEGGVPMKRTGAGRRSPSGVRESLNDSLDDALEALNVLRALAAHVNTRVDTHVGTRVDTQHGAHIRALSCRMRALSRELAHCSAQAQRDCLGSVVESS